LRGTPNGYVPADVYLILLDGDSEDSAGNLDQIFYIAGMQFGTNGYLVLRQAGSTYTVASGATDLVATGSGWGTAFSSRTTDIENRSVSVIIVQSNIVPAADTDTDANDDGTLDRAAAAWTLRDAIGNIDGGASDTGYGFLNTTGNGNGSVPAGSSLFNISGTSLRATSSFDFEVGSTYTITARVTDAGGLTFDKQFTITVTNLDEVAPTITSGGTAAAINENSGAGQVIYTATATDSGDISLMPITFSLGGTDAGLFSINGSTGAVTLTADPNFETKSSYSFTVTATDAAANASTAQTVTLAINNVNEAVFSTDIFYNQDAAAEKNFSTDLTGQRSMVRRVQVVFDGDVPVPLGAVTDGSFVVTKRGTTNNNIGVTVVSRSSDGVKTTVVLGFTSGTQTSGSLADGIYRLTINYGILNIDGDGLIGSTKTINFHRFFGDSDGDRDVDANDSKNYKAGIKSSIAGGSAWRSLFDHDNDGTLSSGSSYDRQDYDAFFGAVGTVGNFGKRLNPFE